MYRYNVYVSVALFSIPFPPLLHIYMYSFMEREGPRSGHGPPFSSSNRFQSVKPAAQFCRYLRANDPDIR